MSQRNDILYAMISGMVRCASERNSMPTCSHSQDDETKEDNNDETKE